MSPYPVLSSVMSPALFLVCTNICMVANTSNEHHLCTRAPFDTCTRIATMNTTGACTRSTDTPLASQLHETCCTIHKHFCVSFPPVQQRALLCLGQTCFVGKSFSELSWDSCLVRGTLDGSWYCGIVATTFIGVVSFGGYWFQLRVVVSSSCEAGRVSALVVLRLWHPALAKLDVLISACRADWCLIQLLRSWICLSALDALRLVVSSSCEAGRVPALAALRTVVSRRLRSLTGCVLNPSW